MNNDDTIEKLPINIRLRRWAAIPGADGVPLLLRAADTIEEQNTEIERLRAERDASRLIISDLTAIVGRLAGKDDERTRPLWELREARREQ